MNNQLILEDKVISGISINENVCMVTLRGIPAASVTSEIFTLINNYEINVDMINQSMDLNNNLVLSFSCNKDDLHLVDKMVTDNVGVFSKLTFDRQTDLVKISFVGVGMASHFGVAARVFNVLNNIKVPFYQITTSEITISLTVDAVNLDKAVPALAIEFNL